MIDPKMCPFCKQPNRCEAHIPNNDCWCNHTPIPKELRSYIPKEHQMKACICKNCVELFIKDKEKFISKYL